MSDENETNNDQKEQSIVFKKGDLPAGFQIIKKIDEGAFGQVFKVLQGSKMYAMKIELNSMKGGSAIKLEIDVLKDLKIRNVPNFPTFVKAGKTTKYHYMVMELLGENLRTLKNRYKKSKSLTVGTWTRIAIQCLYIIKSFHDNGFLHRDIKPANFTMGPVEEEMKSRWIYLLDFGISRRFVLKRHDAAHSDNTSEISKNTKINPLEHCWRLPRRRVEFRGTTLYASPNAHDLKELGRIDDIWSMMFMIASFIDELPWATVDDEDLTRVKKSAKLECMFKDQRFKKIDEHLRSSNYFSTPDYNLVYQTFKVLLDESNTSWDDLYDWETRKKSSVADLWRYENRKNKIVFTWEEPKDYFEKNIWADLQIVPKHRKKNISIDRTCDGFQKANGNTKNKPNQKTRRTRVNSKRKPNSVSTSANSNTATQKDKIEKKQPDPNVNIKK